MNVKCYIKRVDGRIERLAGDETDPRNIPQGFTKSSSIPGGWGSCSFTLSREAMKRDLDPYDELIVHGDGNQVLFEGYGIEYPGSDGDSETVTVQATGWASSLKDIPCPNLVPVDRRFDSWERPSLGRETAHATSGNLFEKDYTASTDDGILFSGTKGEPITAGSLSELVYTAPSGVTASRVTYRGTAINTGNTVAPGLLAASNAALSNGVGYAGMTMDNTLRSATVVDRKYLAMQAQASAAHTPASPFLRTIDQIAVYGHHPYIPKTSVTGEPDGVLASHVLNYLIQATCPNLNVKYGPGGIEESTFVIPHLVLTDVDSVEDAVLQVNRFDISDWGVYENRTPFLRPPGTGRTFVARTDDNGVTYNDAGLTGDDLYTGVIATYSDPTGRSLSVGPPGSGCDTESWALVNFKQNALNRRGRERIGKISISATAVERDVIQTAYRWLAEKNLLETRGDAEVSGWIRDVAGVACPVSEIKAGDQIIFPDREWKERRIVEESYSGDTDTTSLSLDAAPSKVDAMMERLGIHNEAANV